MLRFFRRIRKRLLDDGHLPRYAAYAVGEILLVVVGILIALQINNLNEERKEAALAATYIENLKQDMISDLETLQSVLDALEFYEDEGFYSLNVIDEAVVEIDKVKFLKSLIWNNHYQVFRPSRSTFDDLISSGNIRLIHNNELKVALSRFYLQDDWMEQFGGRAKDTYWYVLREELFKNVDPMFMRGFYESEYFPDEDASIDLEDIEVDFSALRQNKLLKDGISRALSLRVWHRNELLDMRNQIQIILAMLDSQG
jgi:hypothetical protein